MKNPSIGELEKRDIQTVVTKVLRRLENPEPPLVLDDVRELLRLDRQYFSSTDDGAIREIASKLKCGFKQLISRPTLLKDVIVKAKLSALWLPDKKRILIDNDVPILKHRWMEVHEVIHSLIPWHQEFMLGDSALELSPACHATIEAEANYGAGQLVFLMNRFVDEARSLPLTLKTLVALKAKFGNSINATLWRCIEEACPERAVVGLISSHPRHSDGPSKYCVESPLFRSQFGHNPEASIYAACSSYCKYNRTGPLGAGEVHLPDRNGDLHVFHFESFATKYETYTLGVHQKRLPRVNHVLVGAALSA